MRICDVDLETASLQAALSTPRMIIDTIKIISLRCSLLVTPFQEYVKNIMTQGKIKIYIVGQWERYFPKIFGDHKRIEKTAHPKKE